MKRYWELVRGKVDAMSLRERVMLFAAAAFTVIYTFNAALLEPLFSKQKNLSAQVAQQQEKMKELQTNMQVLLQSRRDDQHSPLHLHIAELEAQLQEDDAYLQSRDDHLVAPGEIADILEQMLQKNQKLQLIKMESLPLSLLIERPVAAASAPTDTGKTSRQIYKHGVQITVRGGYLDMLEYLAELEKLPSHMFWGEASLSVEHYPEAVLTVTVYTLSLDKTWLTV